MVNLDDDRPVIIRHPIELDLWWNENDGWVNDYRKATLYAVADVIEHLPTGAEGGSINPFPTS